MESVEQEVKHKVQNLKLRYYNGLRFHDREGAIEARRELLRYGKEHPETGINAGTIDKMLEASVKSHTRITKEQIMGHTFAKGFRPTVEKYMEGVGLEQ